MAIPRSACEPSNAEASAESDVAAESKSSLTDGLTDTDDGNDDDDDDNDNDDDDDDDDADADDDTCCFGACSIALLLLAN